MAIQQPHYRFTRAEYHKMVDAGILHEDSPVELIEGEILEMSPIGRRHKASVDRLTRLFSRSLGDAAIVRVQSSVVLGDRSEPEPDLALLRWRDDFYATADEMPDDVLLIIEVADSSEGYDRQTKAPLYARYGIPELWIAMLNADQVIVYRDPMPDGYAMTRVARRGESISPLAFPDLAFAVEEILGPRPDDAT
jgi:Uma2 family endonuclease